jgi:hypothetical protein
MGAPYISSTSNGQTTKIGCGFLIVILSLVAFLWHPSFKSSTVKIFDDAEIFDSSYEQTLIKSLPKIGQELECNFVIVNKSEVRLRNIAIEADQAAKKVNEEQNWLWRKLFPLSGHSITVFYSEKPSLLQIRYGRYIQHKARIAEIDYGPKYSKLQTIKFADGTPNLIAIANSINNEIRISDPPFFKSWIYKIITILDLEIFQFIAMPHFELWNGMASLVSLHIFNGISYIVSNYYLFIAIIVFSLVFTFSLYELALSKFGTPVQTAEGIEYRTSRPLGCMVYMLCFAFMIIVIYPFFGFFVISAGTRAEDLLMMQSIGLANNFVVPQKLSWYFILLAVVITFVAKLVLTIIKSNDGQIDDADAGLSVIKSLFTLPVLYFIFPAWAVIIYTCFVLSFSLLFIIFRLLRN